MFIANQEEMDVVSSMQLSDRQVFYFLIGQTDVETGIVGKGGGISYVGISAAISETMRQGKRTPLIKFSVKEVRNSIDRLIKVGVIRRLSHGFGRRSQVFIRLKISEAGCVDANPVI